MLKRKLCEATLTWKLNCDGPLLIADGRYDYDKVKGSTSQKEKKGEFPHKVFISHEPTGDAIEKVVRAVGKSGTLQLPFYVPGTSLRGPFRAQAERIIRSLLPENATALVTACDPFQDDTTQTLCSCSKRLEKLDGKSPYAVACPACKLFGCTGTASRIQFTDAEIEPGYRSIYRDMIGIDRFTGGVFQGANMRFHALENTQFTTTVTVTNFELWQLGLLAYVFRDFEEGLVPIGFGKTKGFGLVKGHVEKITISYPAGKCNGTIQHLGSLASEAEQKTYKLSECAPPPCSLTNPTVGILSLYEIYTVADLSTFWTTVAPAFNAFIDAREREAAA